MAVIDRRLLLYLAVTALGAALLIAFLPALLYQAVIVVVAWSASAGIILARARRTLDPAWIIVVALYLLSPVGALLIEFGIGLPTLAAMVVGFLPFVAAALWIHPRSRGQVLRLAPLILLVVLGGVSLLWSSDRTYGAEKLSIWLFTGLIPAFYVLVLTSASRRVAWRVILVAALVSSIAYLLFAQPTAEFPDQPTLLGGNPIWQARAAYIGALVALFGPFPTWVRIAVMPIFLANGIMTGSLGPLVGFALGALAGIVRVLKAADAHDRRVPLAWAGLVLTAGFAVLVLFSGTLDPIVSSLVDDSNVGSRASYLGDTQRLFLSSPVLGGGLGSFASLGVDDYPHNLVAEVTSELGLVGLLALGAWVVVALRGALSSPILLALVVATGLFSLFSGSIASNTEFWLFTALAAAMLPGRERVDQALDVPSGQSTPRWRVSAATSPRTSARSSSPQRG